MTAPAHQFRVTKCDPARRDHKGVFHGGEWTSISNVGDQFEGVTLSMAEYGRVEDAYVEAAQRFMMETGVALLTVRDLDNPSEAEARRFPPEGTTLDMKAFGRALRSVLREDSWCRFESPDGFVHVGYDYYMFVGTTRSCEGARNRARELGLFVEEHPSPWAIESRPDLPSGDSEAPHTDVERSRMPVEARGKTIRQLTQELATFDDPELEVRMALDIEPSSPIDFVGRGMNPRSTWGSRHCCVLFGVRRTP